MNSANRRVVLAGGTGFIGGALNRYLAQNGYEVVTLSRGGAGIAHWDGETVGDWKETLEGAAGVVNLAGTPISAHWSAENKLLILQSRSNSTRAIGEAIQGCKVPPSVWLNLSGVGYYGNRGDEILNESSGPGAKGDFLVDTCVAWEHAQTSMETPKTRQVILRTGPVIGRGGGFMAPLMSLTKWFLGGHVGSGRQFLSWIHMADLCRLVTWTLEKDVEGPLNAVSPNPETNDRFMYVLRSAMRRPWAPPVPSFAIRIFSALGGPDASLLLDSQRVLPSLALEHGFEFIYPELVPAIRDLLG